MLVLMVRMVLDVEFFVLLGEAKPRLEMFSSFRAREDEFDLTILKRFFMRCPLMRLSLLHILLRRPRWSD